MIRFKVIKDILQKDGSPFIIPRDSQYSPISLVFGYDDKGNIVPIALDSEGRVVVKKRNLKEFSGTLTIPAQGSQEILISPTPFQRYNLYTTMGISLKKVQVEFYQKILPTSDFSLKYSMTYDGTQKEDLTWDLGETVLLMNDSKFKITNLETATEISIDYLILITEV